MVAAVADEISNTMRNLQLANNSQNLRNNIPVENPGNLNRSNASRVDSNQGSSIRLPSGDPLTQAVYRPDKVSSVISNWNVKFTGMANDMPVEDFIYRINSLTIQCLNANWNLLYQFANVLFSGPALQFYWRFQRTSSEPNWFHLCTSLRERYREQRTDEEIKDSLRHRKQKSGENFDDFLDAILTIADALREPMSDSELVTNVKKNLKPELRLELLHVLTPNIASLRAECHKHERFLISMAGRSAARPPPNRRFVNELVHVEESREEENYQTLNDVEINAMRKAERYKCWNWEETGHRYHDCLKARRIFCYGCGRLDTYKPSCLKCNPPSENS